MEVVFDNIEKRYGDLCAVKNLNLTIAHGSLHFLLGPSGCGKTTLLRLLAGLTTPSSGRILFDGRDVTHLHPSQRGSGIVFQNYALWPHMTVRQHIEYGLKNLRLKPAQKVARVFELLAMMHLTDVAARLPAQLSGGQQQRVALARALAIKPEILLLDEPLSHLDASLRHEMRDNIGRIHQQTGLTTLYVTHDQTEALSMGTTVSVMVAGEVLETAAPRQLYQHPQTPMVANLIGEMNMFDGVVIDLQNGVMHIQTSLGIIAATNYAREYQNGEDVIVSFRPAALLIAAPEASYEHNTFSLTVERLIYLGDSEQICFSSPSGAQIKSHRFNVHSEHRLGQQLSCHVRRSDILVLAEHQERG